MPGCFVMWIDGLITHPYIIATQLEVFKPWSRELMGSTCPSVMGTAGAVLLPH